MILGEFTQDTLREAKLDSQNRIQKINRFLDCGAFGSTTFLFECDSPMDMQFGADGAFYLLTYGDSFFNVNADAGMYKWEYVKGQRAPRAVLTTNRYRRPAAADGELLERGFVDEDPGDSIRFEWDFGDGSPISTESNPTHVYTQRGRFTARLTVFDSSGQQTSTSTVITVGNTTATITISAAARGRDLRVRRQDPVLRVGGRPRGRRRAVLTRSRSRLCSGTTRTATRRSPRRAAAASCRRSPRTSRTAATCSA